MLTILPNATNVPVEAYGKCSWKQPSEWGAGDVLFHARAKGKSSEEVFQNDAMVGPDYAAKLLHHIDRVQINFSEFRLPHCLLDRITPLSEMNIQPLSVTCCSISAHSEELELWQLQQP